MILVKQSLPFELLASDDAPAHQDFEDSGYSDAEPSRFGDDTGPLG